MSAGLRPLGVPDFVVADWPWSSVVIPTELVNAGDVDLVLTGCYRPNRPLRYRLTDDDWARVPIPDALFGPCFFEPLHIRPGAIHRDTLRVPARFDPERAAGPVWMEGISVEGLHRLEQWAYLVDDPYSFPHSLLPHLELVSLPFEILPDYPLTSEAARNGSKE